MKIVVTDLTGHIHQLEALDGWRVMEVIRDWGLPIKAECGGACACATCHVYVDEEWMPKLLPPGEEEARKLDEVYHLRPNSRLSCQILFSAALDGLQVTLAPETA